jgi:hypothetical protein
LTDRVAATTLSVAIRDALAGLIGVQVSELVCDVKQSLTEDGQKCFSILVFDRFAAGYASGAHRFIEVIFRLARGRLDCPKTCDSACPSCVLDYDQRFDADSLDRHAGLRVLTPEWLNDLQLPVDMRLLGEGSRVEVGTLAEGVLRESGRRDATEGVRDFVCVRHSMTERSDYANEEEDNEGGGSRGGGDAVDPQGAD